jgi:hypothetical protein
MVVMAASGSGQQAFAPVLAAMATMRDGQREQKKAAHVFLESFQKSVRSWWGLPYIRVRRLTANVERGMADHDRASTVRGRC